MAFIPFGTPQPIQYFQRDTGLMMEEKVPGEKWLYWLYYNPVGQLSLEAMVKRKLLSGWYGQQMDAPSSKEKIKPFIEDYQIEMSDFQDRDYQNFNDFFYRKIKPNSRPISTDSQIVTSPADGKVLVFADIKEDDFIIKGYRLNMQEFLQNDSLAKRYEHASLMIFRLCPTDYHRYHFPVGGEVVLDRKIDGDYYSVSPIALKKKVELMTLNKREYTLIETKNFGSVLMMEVGATMVGSMISTYKDPTIEKGEEKGYFKFGGSTVVLLFEEGKIEIDPDLLENSTKELETEVKMGEGVARRAINE